MARKLHPPARHRGVLIGTGPYQNDGGVSYRACVDKIVRLAANRGAYVAIDLHRFRAPKAEHAAFWKDVAAKYKNHPAVLFDLFNEPNGITWEIWRDGGWVGEQGKHDELVAKGGIYARFIDSRKEAVSWKL